ncbi:MAG: transcriptional regulator [Actinomycetota bacterium]|jgi:nitrogen regulatory protein PII
MSRHDGLTRMTRIEVVVGASDAPAVTDLLTGGGAIGYTVLPVVGGLGHHGEHQGRLHFNDRDGLRMILTVVADGRADALVAAVRSLLSDRHGVLFVSDTWVSRPEYFT